MLSEEELIQIRNYNFDCLEGKSSDYPTMLAAVKANPFALQSASADLKANREMVLAAVKQDPSPLTYGSVLQYASKELQADREVVLEAVKKSRHALSHASDSLRDDREIVIMAMISYPDAFSDDVKDNPDLKLLNDFFKYVFSSGQKQLSVTLIAHLLKESGNDRDQVLRVLRTVRTLLEKQYEIKSYKDELIKQETLDSRVKLLLEISHPYRVSMMLDVNTSDYMPIYGDGNQDKPTVSSDIFDSYSSLMLCIGKVQGSQLEEQEFIKILNATCLQSDISLLTRLFWGNNIFQEFMDEKKLWRQIDQKYVSLIEDLSSSNVSMLVDWRIVHLLHVFGGIEGTEIAQAFIHTQSLINCLNETGNEDVAKDFSTDCFDTGYIGHYFCLMVTSDSEGNKTIKNLDDLKAGDTITIFDRAAPIFEADYRQVSYTVGADVNEVKSFFKSCERKEVNSVKKEFKALVDSNALSQQAYMTSSELGDFDPAKRYGGKCMKKAICTMNQKLFIREALILKYGLEEGLKEYKKFSTILRMRAFEKFYLQSDASLFLEDEIAMVKNIISRVRKGYITEEFIVSSESVSPIMKALWVKLIQEEYDDSQILLMIGLIKKTENFSLEQHYL